MEPLSKALSLVKPADLARQLGVSVQRLSHWRTRGLPRTEWTGETKFADGIEAATGGRVTKRELLTKRRAA